MTLSFAAPIILALGCMGLALASPQVPLPTPPAAPSATAATADTFAGRIDKARFLHGMGWVSHTDMGLVVTAADRKEMAFYLRANSIISDATGKPVSISDLPRMLGKKVEIKYAVITDATGNLEKTENGQNGVVSMHFLDWTAGSR
jgi:hypothetical protein